jgi:hypothetical protein
MNSAIAFVDELLGQQFITQDDLQQHVYIIDKQDELTLYRPNRLQAHLQANLTGRDLIIKPRQSGISTFFIIQNTIKAMTERARIGTMAHEIETTQKLRRMAGIIWENLPNHLRPERGLDNAKTTSYKNTGSEVTIATAGNKKSGRGGTYPGGFHGSEFAFWDNAQDIIGGILQGVPMHSPIVLETTTNGAQGLAYEIAMEALRGEGIFTLHFYEWWWVDEYQIPLQLGEALSYTDEEQRLIHKHHLTPEQIKWRRYKMLELRDFFFQEYPEDIMTAFLTSGNGVFKFDDRIFYTPPTSPIEDHDYVMGVDWGQNPDSTVASVWDMTEYKEVALLRLNKLDYEVMIHRVAELATYWGCMGVMPEFNSIGAITSNMLRDRLIEMMPEKTPKIQFFTMTNRSKNELVSLFQRGLTEGLQLIDHKVGTQELRTFESRQTPNGAWAYGHPSGGHDDTVIARMIAHFAGYKLRG